MATKKMTITRAKKSTFNFKNQDSFAVLESIDTGDTTESEDSIFKIVAYPINQKAIAENCIKKNNFPYFYAYGSGMVEGAEFTITVNDSDGKMTINASELVEVDDKKINDLAKKYSV